MVTVTVTHNDNMVTNMVTVTHHRDIIVPGQHMWVDSSSLCNKITFTLGLGLTNVGTR